MIQNTYARISPENELRRVANDKSTRMQTECGEWNRVEIAISLPISDK